MRRHSCWTYPFAARQSSVILFLILILAVSTGVLAADSPRSTAAPGNRTAAQKLSLLPLAFEANQGQVDGRVRFLSRGPGYTLFLTQQETVLRLANGKESATLRLQFAGANPAPKLEGADQLRLRSNYFIGNVPSKWRRNVPNYGRVVAHGVYAGTDVAFYGREGKLENDFIIAPGYAPSTIVLHVTGANGLSVDSAGDLLMTTSAGAVRLLKPAAYQIRNGVREQVTAGYRLMASDQVGMTVGKYDRKLPLVIDPVIDYSTYVAAGADLTVAGIAANSSTGEAWIAGTTKAVSFTPAPTSTNSTNADATNPKANDDIFLLKLSADGATAELAVFIGGTGAETSAGVVLDGSGNPYIAGGTAKTGSAATDFPMLSGTGGFSPPQNTNAGSNDAFLAGLDASTGNLTYTTFLGGTSADVANALYFQGHYVFLTGGTASSGAGGFPTVGAFQASRAAAIDAFMAVVIPANLSIASISCNSSNDVATVTTTGNHGLANGDLVDVQGTAKGAANNTDFTQHAVPVAVTVTGSTTFTFPMTATKCKGPGTDSAGAGGVVTGSEQYGTYLGGSAGVSSGSAIVASALSNVYVAGTTADDRSGGTKFPNNNGAQTANGGGTGDGFITRFDATKTGSASEVDSTFFGGSGADAVTAITLGPSNNVYVAGSTGSTSSNTWLCGSSNAHCTLQPAAGSTNDAFVAKFAANLGTVTWGTYVGGSGDDAAYGIQVDSNSNVYVAGATQSNNIFTAVSAGNLLGAYSAGSDAFLAVIAGGGGATQSWSKGMYFGGAGDEGVNTSLAFGPSNTIFLAGSTTSSDLWTTNTAAGYQPTWPVASGSTSSSGFAVRVGSVLPTTTTVNATEAITNQTNGQAANSTVLADTGSSHSSALYSYTICNGTFVSNTCTPGAATASDVRFNWPVPRFGSSVVNLIVVGGSGYTVAPTVTIDPPTSPGTTATVSVSLSSGKVVLTLTDPGSGYSTVPNVNVSGGNGTGASATAVLGPAPALFTTATSAPGMTCTDAAGFGVTCNAASLPAGATAQVNITATTTSAANISTGTIPVTARPTAGAANATFPTVTSTGLTIVPSLDLQVAVTQPSDAHVGTVAAPNSVTFTITATNAGPGSTDNVTVDTSLLLNATVMTSGFNLDATTPVTLSDSTNWTFSSSNGHVLVTSKNGYSWPAATPLTITIKGAFDPTVGFGNNGITPVSARAVISTTNTSAIDVTPGNNTDSKNFNILRDSDLTAATTDNTSTAIRLSDPLILSTDVTNNGTDDATNVAVAYTFAGGVAPASRNFTGFDTCSAAANVITCSFNTLAVGGANKKTGVLTLTAPSSGWPLAAGSTSGTMTTAVAESSVDVNDTTPGNNSQNVVSNLKRSSDLQMGTLTDNSATTPVALAGPLLLTAQIKNAGPDDATSVVVHFTLTDGGANAYTLGTNSFPSGCAAATNVITCTVGALSNGTTASYSVQVIPDPAWVSATSNVGTISSVADVSSADVLDDGTAGAPGANNTSASLTNHLARSSDLQVTSYTDNSQVTPVSQSGTLTLTSNLKNGGPDDAIDAVVTFTISGTAASAYTLGTTTFPSGCVQAALVITCTVGPIAKNATPSYSVNLTPDPAWVSASSKTGTITSVAQISSPHVYDDGTTGAAGANNSSTPLTSNIARKSDLRTTTVTDNTGVTPAPLTGTVVITPTIANFGPDDANGNIVVKVTFPSSGYTINNGLTTFNGGCVKDGTTPTIADCTVNGSLANGANISYDLAVTPDAAWLSTSAATGTISPSVQVSSTSVYDNGTSGAPGTNNTNATLVTHLQRRSDLQLTNLTDNSTINPVALAAPPVGTGLKYVTSIKNAGPDTAEGVKVVYTLPSAAYTFSSTTLGTCSQVTTTLTCTIGQLTMVAGTVNFTVTVAPDLAAIATSANPPTASVNTSAQVISTAVLDDGTAGAPGSNNNGSVNSALERQSDLKIATMTDNSPVPTTGPLTLTANIQNLGPDTAPNVSMSFALPNAQYTYTTNTGFNSCVQAASVVTCSITSMPRATTTTAVSISVTPDPAAVPSSAPSATATTNTQISSVNTVDTNNGNDTGSVQSTIARKADLQITSFTDNTTATNPVSLAGTLTYSGTLKNAGPDDATSVDVAFTLPTAGYTYLTNTGFGSCSQTTNVITCHVSGTVANAATPSFTLSVTPDPASVTTSVPPTVVSTSATVSSAVVVDDGTSGAPGTNNTKSRNSNVARRSDLQFVTLTDNSSAGNPVPLTGPLTFATQIKNFGPDDAVGVVVKYTVPAGFAFSASTGYTGCSQTSTLITCSIGGSVTNGSNPSFSMSVVPGAAALAAGVQTGTPGTSATVSSTSVFDDGTSGSPNPTNNNAAVTSNIARRSDLRIVSFTDNSPVGDAGPLTFTTQIQNFGPDDAGPAVVTYSIPANSTLMSHSYGSGNCVQATTTVTCQVTSNVTVAAGPLSFTLSIDPQDLAAGGPINPQTSVAVSSAAVWDDGTNGAAGTNNTAGPLTSSIQSVVHLSFTHTSSPAVGTFANLGQTVKYTIHIHNASTTTGGALTSSAQGVVVTENLPSTFISRAIDASSTSGWSCNFAASPVSCSLSGLIAPGSTSANDAILVISGVYTDDPTQVQLPGGGSYAPGTGNSGNITATISTTSSDPDGFSPIDTSTDIRRLVALGATAASNPAAGSGTLARLGTDVLYTIVVTNPSTLALPTDTATAVFVDIAIPANFGGVSVDGTSTTGWSCVPANFATSPVRCTQANPLAPNGSFTLVLRGQYSDSATQSVLTGGLGTAGISVTPGVTQSVQAATVPLTTVTANTDLQRLIHLTATAASNPAVGTFADLETPVTYTFNVSNASTVNSVATDSAAGVVLKVTLPATFISPVVTSSGWDCAGFAANPASCSFSGSIAPGSSSATPLVISGRYSNATAVLPGGGAYAPGTGNVSVNADLTATASVDPTPGSVATSTDIRRDVQLTLTQAQPSVNPVSLGATESYTLRVSNSNAVGTNDAAGVTVADTLPSGFILTSASGTGWSCGGAVSGVVTCTVSATIPAGASSNDLVITGSYDKNIALPGTGSGTRTNSAAVTSTLSFDQPGTAKTASVDTTIQRNVNLGLSMSATPNPIGAGGAASNVVTYTVTVSNTGVDPVSGSSNSVKVDFTAPLPSNFTNVTATGSGSSTVTCDTVSSYPHIICTYPSQDTAPTVITIKGQFDQSTVASTGSALAQASVAVSTADGIDTDPNNNGASSTVTVVDTPAGTNVVPLLNSSGHPITVTYPTVTQAGITTQAVTQVPPTGFHEPAIDYPTIDYSTALPNYFVIASDPAAPVTYTTPVTVCVAYTTLAGVTFTKPERVRFFDATGKDITSAWDAATVCGKTANPGPNLGTFTVREPKNHAPVAKAAAQQLFSGKIGTNQFTLDASGTTDADIQQVCKGSPAQMCGDTLTYTWTGPPGMNSTNGSNTFTQVVPATSSGALGAPGQVTGSFPLGISTVTLTVTDQTGASSTSQVSVSVNSFTLSTTNQNAVIAAGQSTSFQVVPQDANKQPLQFTGNMTLTCTGVKTSDNSSLAANHVTCSVSPNVIQQGQFSTALIVTVGPNFSQSRPVGGPPNPTSVGWGRSNGGGALAMLMALMSPALMGIVMLPGRSRRWKTLLILALLLGCLGVQLGCGGTGNTPVAQTIPATTPAGTYTITITGTAAGGVTSTNTFTLTVQ